MIPVVLIPGTWGNDDRWWRPGSPFVSRLINHAPLLCPWDMYNWSDDLNGTPLNVLVPPPQTMGAAAQTNRKYTAWEAGAAALRWYVEAKLPKFDAKAEEVHLISHSHGGQVAAMAIANGLRVRTWISVAMPIRADLTSMYQAVPLHCVNWTQIYTDEPWTHPMQELGSDFGERQTLWGNNIFEPGNTHSGLVDHMLAPKGKLGGVDLWDKRGWWEMLK